MEYIYTSNSTEDTLKFAKKVAANLERSDIIVLTGELGSGKTKFVEGILSYFGIEDNISSPTFTIVNQFKKPYQKNISRFALKKISQMIIFEF